MCPDNPLVSLVVCSYKHERFIEDCLQSVMDQTYPNIELLVSDDASPDSTWNIILSWKERLEKRFPTVILNRNEQNIGLPKSLNNILKKCSGEFIKLISSDDMLLPECIDTISEKSSRQSKRRYDILKQGDKDEEIYHNRRRV